MMDALLNGRYRLIELVGAGGMAQVYQARDTLLERPVAVKLLRPQYAADEPFLARFLQEARSAANLSHPNIVAVYDVGEDTLPGEATSRPYIVMEYVAGRDLKTLIQAEAPLSVARALDIGAQIALALAHAHDAGLIHRDVKPQNVLLTRDGRAKVTDFGIARALATSSISEAGVVLGTVHYLSPEQAAGDPATPLSDVYALGVILYEMLTGQLPFTGETPVAVAVKHLQEEPPSPRERNPLLPPPVEDLVLQAMDKDPARRFASAAEMAQALMAYRDLGYEATTAHRPVRRGRSRYGGSRRAGPRLSWASAILGGALVGLLALAAAAVLLGWQAVQSANAPAASTPVAAASAIPAPPTPLPTATSQPRPIMPALAGQSLDEALQVAASLELRLHVNAWHYDEQAPALSIIAQDVPAGRPVFAGDTVAVTVSRGSAGVTVPTVAGHSYDEALVLLAERGLAADVTWVWHDQAPVRRVLEQSPAAQTALKRGDRVHLTVSNGQTVRLDANLANQVRLADADLPPPILAPGQAAPGSAEIIPRYGPGQTIPLTLWWRALTNINKDYVASVQVLDAGGQLVMQQDQPPGQRPTVLWLAGDVVRDDYRLALPADAAPGRYRIVVSLYQAGAPWGTARLPVLDARGRTVGDSVLVTPVLLVAE
ncbi:MAG: protein kinase [Chloroflexi bacterium]|nr:protein kinase [Chloroflexota bacterium]